jgi:hypothetical protein
VRPSIGESAHGHHDSAIVFASMDSYIFKKDAIVPPLGLTLRLVRRFTVGDRALSTYFTSLIETMISFVFKEASVCSWDTAESVTRSNGPLSTPI